MILELLFALAGNTGDVIVQSTEPCGGESGGDEAAAAAAGYDRGSFRVSPTVTFVSASERVAIDRLVQAGYLYAWLRRAAARSHFHASLYVRALSRGIDAVLGDYLALLRAIEVQAFAHPGEVTIAHLQSRVRSFTTVLSVVRAVVEAIEARGLVGGQILNLLHEHACTGMPVVKQRITALANRVLRVFYGQLASWVSHGILLDDYDEFMVSQRVETFANRGSNSDVADAVSVPISASAFPSVSVSSTSTAYASDDAHLIKRRYNPIVAEHEWNTKYTLRLSMVPTAYVRYTFAQKALFVGKAMMLLKQLDPRSVSKDHRDEYAELCNEDNLGHVTTGGNTPRASLGRSANATDDSLSEFNLSEFSITIEQLQKETEFPGQPLEAALERAWKKVNQRLWWVVVRVADLPAHLLALKNYFLMWRGEFFQRFIVESRTMLDGALSPSSPTSSQSLYHLQHDLNSGPLRRAAATAGCDTDDPLFDRFGLRVYMPRFMIDDFVSAGANILTLLGGASALQQQQQQQRWRRRRQPRQSSAVGARKTPLVLCRRDAELGAAWHTELMIVEHGFESEVSAELHPGTTLSFVVQTDRLAAMPIACESKRSAAVAATTTVAASAETLDNALVISFHRPERRAPLRLRATLSARDGSASVQDTAEAVTLLGETDLNMPDGEALRFRVAFTRAEPDVTTSSSSRSGGGDMGIQVFVSGSTAGPALDVSVSLRKKLRLAPTSNGGGAWVGLVGVVGQRELTHSLSLSSSQNDTKATSQITSRANVHREDEVSVTKWRFTGQLPKTKALSAKKAMSALSSALPSQPEPSKWDMGRCLEGVYHVAWPLHLVVTQNALSQYNALFQFLFSIGRVSSALRGSWAVLKGNDPRFLCRLPGPHMHASRLRSRMAFLVDAMQYYYHVDVIASQSHTLNKVLSNTTDFEKVQTAHAKFLAAVSRQCLLHVRTVRDALDLVLGACGDLCTHVEDSAGDLNTKLSPEELKNIDRDYTRHSAYLFLLLSGISEKLRTRLDFNGHMSGAAAEFGSVAAAGINSTP